MWYFVHLCVSVLVSSLQIEHLVEFYVLDFFFGLIVCLWKV